MDDGFGTFLKFIGGFSAFLGPFSLLMVMVLPPKLNWIGVLVACVMFGVIATCFFYLDDQQERRPSACSNFTLMFLFFFIFPFLSMLYTETSWIMYPLERVHLWMENAYHVIAYLMFIYEKTRNSEAYQLIKVDENKDGHLSYLMLLGILSYMTCFICLVFRCVERLLLEAFGFACSLVRNSKGSIWVGYAPFTVEEQILAIYLGT
ncbi:hypothetical protein E3N88_26410 [Mikania micrantha]|uniref:Uncharacterized protein n=1 Tax=Mikania micrantha TaxID=192012 RepID=A0A5N6NA55_9ASTR|nr:hypothetical protein E3N88_26410 [Mikania micrantha]